MQCTSTAQLAARNYQQWFAQLHLMFWLAQQVWLLVGRRDQTSTFWECRPSPFFVFQLDRYGLTLVSFELYRGGFMWSLALFLALLCSFLLLWAITWERQGSVDSICLLSESRNGSKSPFQFIEYPEFLTVRGCSDRNGAVGAFSDFSESLLQSYAPKQPAVTSVQ